jgi:alkaline phosphatase
MLQGNVKDHDNGMSPLALDDRGMPIDFDPRDYESECGNMVMWDATKGGTYPWDANYYTDTPDTSTGFDPEYIMRHATDSAATASAYATGHKTGANMMSVNLYEEDVSTLVEDAMMCGKSGGVVTSVPMLHATPGSFITHSNYRKNGPQMQRGLRKINPTFVSGTCASRYQPSPKMKMDMINGTLSKQWTFLTQQENVTAEVRKIIFILVYENTKNRVPSVPLALHNCRIFTFKNPSCMRTPIFLC